jgi:hypothetical protein
MVLASCGNKYYGTNFPYTVLSSLLIAPCLQTIQFLFFWTENNKKKKKKKKKKKSVY